MSEVYQRIRAKLEAEEKKESLPIVLRFFKDLVSIQADIAWKAELASIDEDEAGLQRRLENGEPLLPVAGFPLEPQTLEDDFRRVVEVFRHYPELFAEIPQALVAGAGLFNREAVSHWLATGQLPPGLNNGSAELAQFIIYSWLHPWLAGYACRLVHLVEQERWRRRYCPVCGSVPDFSFLDAERGARWLVCSACDTEWLFQRLECPRCGCQDQNQLGYFSDEAELYRLYVCHKCRRYLKAIDLRKKEEEVLWPLERLLTVDIDKQARQQGYLGS